MMEAEFDLQRHLEDMETRLHRDMVETRDLMSAALIALDKRLDAQKERIDGLASTVHEHDLKLKWTGRGVGAAVSMAFAGFIVWVKHYLGW